MEAEGSVLVCTLKMIPAMVVPVFFAFFMMAPEALFASSHAFLQPSGKLI
jgi:hypothetical protein